MTALKPKVVKVLMMYGGYWAWYCGCGYIEKSGSWKQAMKSSVDHCKRLHASERDELAFKAQVIREAADWLDNEAHNAGILEPDCQGLDAFMLRQRADQIEAGETE